MAEFQKVMREWVRSRKVINENKLSCCPLEMFSDDYIANIEKEVMAWAAEQHEPVYPTWSEWLIKIGGAVKKLYAQQYHYEAAQPTQLIEVVEVLDEPIPADIAQKLGITPKENN